MAGGLVKLKVAENKGQTGTGSVEPVRSLDLILSHLRKTVV